MESIDSVTCSVRTLKGSQCRRFVFWRASAEFSVWLSFLVLQNVGAGRSGLPAWLPHPWSRLLTRLRRPRFTSPLVRPQISLLCRLFERCLVSDFASPWSVLISPYDCCFRSTRPLACRTGVLFLSFRGESARKPMRTWSASRAMGTSLCAQRSPGNAKKNNARSAG